ncbi:2-succinyl-5-enolpyruvyl-6-hydroxy-3-cyclohexene-1-carboxylic-acid synthase [Candidatus Aerophobetes bacterium]|uniref:2-succinyl-5-enolpyruvyl-6-hydroxy-3-cyclohexene-1-carboxylate synthase n=1 Tax=Aerophobetes bacterium TaxID=2030807 RepID=A0A2A4WZN8_UNCAE|nr:MAG: 2-succinyl-5-enolpyruvyl-6-hydroxy-3-cyclohexene-1-carboxylic-acid synthase [Candidatus Aerophobetes bacterium]
MTLEPFSQSLAEFIISTLMDKGIRQYFIAPGYRSSPLIQALARSKVANTSVHVDERAIGFLALGFAKATKEIPAIIVTSGTALGNLMPAVMEAYHDNINMLIISADRPFELHGIGANQTTYQENFFAPFTNTALNIPALSASTPMRSIYTALDNLLPPNLNGVAHLNIGFKKPFFKEDKNLSPSLTTPLHLKRNVQTQLGESFLEKEQIDTIFQLCSRYKKGIILVGQKDSAVDIYPLLTLSKILGWPLCIDILSPLAKYQNNREVISHFDLILSNGNNLSSLKIDAILQIGHRFISSSTLAFIGQSKPKLHAHITSSTPSMDLCHSFTHRYVCSANSAIKALASTAKNFPNSCDDTSYSALWQTLDQRAETLLTQNRMESSHGTLLQFFNKTAPSLKKGFALFIGNSLSIRAASKAFKRPRHLEHIFANRGLSGIDGNIATTIGIATGLQTPTIACIGDQTFLHDLSSLQMLKNCPYPIMFVVLDNQGGQIFSRLPIPLNEQDLNHFFINSSPINYAHVAALFDMDYHPLNGFSSSIFETTLSKHTLVVIEIDKTLDETEMLYLQDNITLKKTASV